jgi:hypothetical protein
MSCELALGGRHSHLSYSLRGGARGASKLYRFGLVTKKKGYASERRGGGGGKARTVQVDTRYHHQFFVRLHVKCYLKHHTK